MKRNLLFISTALLALAVTASAVSAQVVADSACPKYAVDIASFATCEGDRVAKDVVEEPRREQTRSLQAGQARGKELPAVDPSNAVSKTASGTRSPKPKAVSNLQRPAK